MLHRSWALALAASVCLFPVTAWAASPNHPNRQWTVLETPHFSVHYYQGEEKTARKIAAAAENSLPRLEKDFGVEAKERIPIVVSRDNFFNGSAEPVKTRIQLDPVLAASSQIGTERFVAHELAHVITFLALQRDLPISRLAGLGTMPTWFLEGIAQYEAEYWYTSNDRMLRLHTLSNTLLTNTERENFPLLGVVAGAAGYNEGFALTRYIFDTYGKDKIATLFKIMRDGEESTFTKALEKAVGTPFPQIEAAWRTSLKEHYAKQTKGIAEHLKDSQTVIRSERGEVNVAPSLSPDGKKLAYLTSRHQDGYLYLRGHVMGFLTLALADADGQNVRELPVGKGRVSGYSWSPDGEQLVVSAVSSNKEGEPTFDLFLYNVKTGYTKQLTNDANATSPAWRPDSNQVAYVETKDGKTFLKLFDTKAFKTIDIPSTSLGDRHAAGLAWAPNGRMLVGSVYATGEGGKLASIDPLSGHVAMLTEGKPEVIDQHPIWLPDSSAIVFSSDRDGMQNLYRLSMKGKRELTQLSKVYTGASAPAVAPDGRLFYVSYHSVGSELRTWRPEGGEQIAYQAPKNVQPGIKLAAGETPTLGRQLPDSWRTRGYEPTMTNDIIMPQLTSDERGSQIGMLAMYSDILDKQQLGLDVRLGVMSQRFSYAATYVNRMSDASWGVTLYDTPNIGIAKTINPERLYDSLYYSREQGVSAMTRTNIGSQTLTAAVGLAHLSVLDPPRGGVDLGLRTGRLQTLSLGWSDNRVKNTSDADLNPSDGYRLGASFTLSDRALGSEFDFAQYALGGERYFPIVPDWRHNLAWRWHFAMTNGDAMPMFLGGVQGGGSIIPLRGYNVGSFAGNRIAYSGLEYTMPINGHLDYQFGPLYFNKLYATAFVEAGDAWSQGATFQPHPTAGAEVRVKTAFMGRQVVIFRVGTVRKLTPDGTWGMYVTF